MPNVTAYIRKDDIELWLACGNKAQLIHDALHEMPVAYDTKMNELMGKPLGDVLETTPDFVSKALDDVIVPTKDRYVATPEGIVGPVTLESKSYKFCKDGHPIPSGRDKCLGKGCKYS